VRTRPVSSKSALLLAAIWLACATLQVHAQTPQPPAQRTDVPVRTVMLFSSGVGFFEHAGTVRGDGTTELRFKTSQINDILKSLVLQDQDGGRVTTITYPTQDPIGKTLRSFQVDITSNPTLADLLNQLRGARVTIQSQAERTSGTILGVEVRRTTDGGEVEESPTLNVLAGATIRSIELQSISSLTLDDPQLQDELAKALAALSQARDQDKKPVTINFSGSGDRRLRIGYVVETPVWKTSYRLLMDDRGSKLQGWAIVENQTDSDWNGVALSLVSGRPLSFVMDLYQPLYATRPIVEQELFAGLRPQVYAGGTAADQSRVLMEQGQRQGQGGAGGGGGRGGAAQSQSGVMGIGEGRALRLSQVVSAGVADPMDMSASINAIADAEQMGELFEYRVGNVTLPRQKSAMIPIVTDSISLERVSIYNRDVLSSHPLNGVRLKNITGKHLLQGPVTVLANGNYAGDARIDNVPPGQERLLSYGVDLEMVSVPPKGSATDAVVSAKIVKGVMHLVRKTVSSVEYGIENKSDRDKTLVIEHPVLFGWTLVDTRKPTETTPAVYRFQGPAPAGKVTTLPVKTENVRTEMIALLPVALPQLLSFTATAGVPSEVRDALRRLVELRQLLADTERQIAERTQQIAAITEEQNRIRENMKTVATSTQYSERLLAKLNEQESSIERLQRERSELATKRDREKAELEAFVAGLSVG
jgi:hypothetical protein